MHPLRRSPRIPRQDPDKRNRKFEKLFLEHLKSKHPHIIEGIKTEKALSDKANAELKQILEEIHPNCWPCNEVLNGFTCRYSIFKLF